MPFTFLTPPSVGDPTKASLAQGLIDNDEFLYNLILSAIGNREIILNGSFETDADSDSEPDGWDITEFTGGTFAWAESTVGGDGESYHGIRAVKFTSPGGGGNGGGDITSADFFEVSEGRPYKIQFAIKSSVADVHNKGEIIWYDSEQTLISTTTFFDEAAANPTDWEIFEYVVEPPADARYAKLRFTGCDDDDTTAGNTYFDDVRIQAAVPYFERRLTITTSTGVLRWKAPITGWYGMMVGGAGGGGGGSDGANGGGGGGGGGLTFDLVYLSAGAIMLCDVGAGGAGGVGANNGSNGSASNIAGGSVLLTGSGGTGGQRQSIGGAGGAGGAASGGRINNTGTTGATRSGATGGDGGEQSLIGLYAIGGTGGGNGVTCPVYGGGGGGAAGSGGSTNGGAGAPGFITILW